MLTTLSARLTDPAATAGEAPPGALPAGPDADFTASLAALAPRAGGGSELPADGKGLPLAAAGRASPGIVTLAAGMTGEFVAPDGSPDEIGSATADAATLAAIELMLPGSAPPALAAVAAAAGPAARATAFPLANANRPYAGAPVVALATTGASEAALPGTAQAGNGLPGLAANALRAEPFGLSPALVDMPLPADSRAAAGDAARFQPDARATLATVEPLAAFLPEAGKRLARAGAEADAAALRSLSAPALPAAPATLVSPTAATAAGSVTAAPVPVPVTDPGFADALSERVLFMSANRLGSAEIRLNPAELGPLRVEIRVEDGMTQVHFSAQQAVTRDAIEQSLPRLRELFAGQGLELSDASVSDQGFGREREGDGEAGRPADRGVAAGHEPDEGAAPRSVAVRHDGLVDTFA